MKTLSSLKRRQVELALISFVIVYLELVVIRWLGTEVRIFSYFKNIPLLAAFLGMGARVAGGEWIEAHDCSFARRGQHNLVMSQVQESTESSCCNILTLLHKMLRLSWVKEP